MNKNYIECTRCKWRLENQPDYDWKKNPCHGCANTRKMIDPQNFFCNMCGDNLCHSITVPSGIWNAKEPSGLIEAKVVGGYESYYLLDMNCYTFNFCEKCLRELFLQCKIKPDITEMRFNGDEEASSWQKDQEAYEYRIWRDSGKHHQAYLNKKCNFVKDCPNQAAYTQLINNDFTENCCCEEHKQLFRYLHTKLTKFIPNVLKPFL